ncbi:hypothetical protein [Nocardioides sp.]|uniref:hypothetical protein n=1 Tax=Nocardioides sp. TaxID=35761 RepID=UPI002CCDB5AC|nr:hypothetical protein [Nocardioides sp.]HXH79512.1 hypothetical protein [Nocardioides sp.]
MARPVSYTTKTDGTTTVFAADVNLIQTDVKLIDTALASVEAALPGKAAAVHTHAGADIASGTVPTARLGSGAASATTYLRGDQTWAAPAGGTGSVTPGAMWMSVAAVDAPATIKARADYVCDGVNDETELNAAKAISDVLMLSEGTFTVASSFWLDRSGLKLVAAGPGSTVLRGVDATVTPLKVGTFAQVAGAANAKHSDIVVQDLLVEVPGAPGAGVCAIDVWGVSKSEFRNVTTKGGYDGWRVHNLDRFSFIGCDAFGQVAAAWHLYQGVVDDVTIGVWASGSGECLAANTTGMLFDTFLNAGGTETLANVNEFNRLTVQGMRFGGSDTAAGTTGVKYLCGVRALTFIACQWRYCRTQIDATIFATANYTSFRLNFTLQGCSLIGTTANPAVDVIRYTGPSSGIYAHIKLIGVHVDKAADFLQIDSGNPTVTIDGLECGSSTGIGTWFNVVAGGPRISATVPLVSGSAEVVVNRIKGSHAVPAAATSVTVTHGLWKTPNTVLITPQSNPGAATRWWWTYVSATQFTINTDVAPGGSGVTFSWAAEV